mgnify:CR=1 FL=1|tara:strand:+ start:849 stop:1013 length:165 start_codon:yes stop_codon:yes gene_type:complete
MSTQEKLQEEETTLKPLIEEFNETASIQQERLQVISKKQNRIELLKELIKEQEG